MTIVCETKRLADGAGISMKDYIVADFMYFPPLLLVLLGGIACWVVVRRLYAKRIYGGAFWHPRLIDLGGLLLCVYANHLMLAR